MDKTVVFVMTHLGADYDFLNTVFNNHPQIASVCSNFGYHATTDIYNLEYACLRQRQANEYKRIFCDMLLQNQACGCRALLKGHKYIYYIRRPEPTLSYLIGSGLYDANGACDYYAFRLQRLSQFAKESGGVFLTWEDVAGQGGFRAVEMYLGLKQTLTARGQTLTRKYDDKVPEQHIRYAEKAYDKYVTRIKKRTNEK